MGIDLTRGREKGRRSVGLGMRRLDARESESVQECIAETRGSQKVWGYVRRELARDGARGFGFGIGCSGVILMARDGRRQVGIG